ncbi:hypothetical protein [Paraflavitalea pollutisoli]|uniref:hypothetical protein n=1 Tax=Paraflavitalea pollutisoli TaxID=3034143 RepID=UPI0023EB224C|nr:hypothetical protein [Paraflavitalea sp. H1-2-19X]
MRIFRFSVFIALLFIIACKDEPKQEPEAPEDSTDSLVVESVDTVLSADAIQTFSTSGIADYARKKSPSFDWARFRMVSTYEEDSLLASAFTPEKDFYKNYGPFLKYSPDSSHFIDLDSYNIDITRDAQGRLTGAEIGPDTEIGLVDLTGKTRSRLLFMGPGGNVEDGLWLDNSTVVLMGTQENQQGERVPTIWRYHIPTKTFFVYELPDPSMAGSLADYWKTERLKGVAIK